MDLILHIGTHKAGSSSIQAFMEANRGRLRAAGYHYPRCCSVFGGNHSPLCGAMLPDPRDDRWEGLPGWEAFVAECRAAGAPTVVVSGEDFSGRLRNRRGALRARELFDSLFETITVVVYLRRQDQYARSLYMEAVRHGFFDRERLGGSFDETVSRIAEGLGDYRRLVGVLERVFGRERLRVRVFEKGQLHPGGLVADFLRTCGIPPAGLDATAARPLNVSPGRKVLTAMDLARRIYERAFGADTGMRHRVEVLGRAHRLLVEAWPDDRRFLGYRPGGARALAERFREGNAVIARKYLGRADGRLFLDERYEELGADESDEVPLSLDDVRLIVTAIEIGNDARRHRTLGPGIAYLRRQWALAAHRARAAGGAVAS